jgi:hypothetical protein
MEAPTTHIPTLLFILFFIIPISGSAQTSQECLVCHGNRKLSVTDSTGAQRSLFLNIARLDNSVHAGFNCLTCHADIQKLPHAEKLAPSACGNCHEDAALAVAESVHGNSTNAEGGHSDLPTCGDCHGTHEIRARSDSLSRVNPRQLAFTCRHCHANPEIVKKYHISIKDPFTAYARSVHCCLTLPGVNRAVTCSSCHGSHRILDANNSESSVYRFNIPQTCGQCHPEVAAEFAGSVHGEAVAHGSRAAPVCTDCHREHEIESSSVTTAPTFAQNVARETCGFCHASKRIVTKYGLRAGRLLTFEASFHGLALHTGRLTVANCGSCHGVHNILPASNPASMINPANLPQTCGQCHVNAGEKLLTGPIHLTIEKREGKIVAIIRSFYVALIVLVIGGMVLHNGLDFIRKTKRALRRN